MGLFTWGDGVNDLYQQWSVHLYHESGWFYGSNHSSSNADVYVYEDFTGGTTASAKSTWSQVKSLF